MFEIYVCFGIIIFAIVMFITEWISPATTAMVVLVSFVITGILTPQEAFSGFTSSSVILFVGMFVIGGALFSTGVAKRIASTLKFFSNSERMIITAIFTISGLMSAFLPNLGTCAVLMPIVIGVSEQYGFAKSKLLLPMVYGSTIGGHITILGTVGNSTIAGMLYESVGIKLTFGDFIKIGLPMMVCGIIFYWFIGHKFLPNNNEKTPRSPKDETQVQDLSWKSLVALLVLIFVCVGILFDIGMQLHVVSTIGAVVLLVTGVVGGDEAIKSIKWKTIFLVAGMLTVATALNKTGAGEIIAKQIVNLMDGVQSPILLISFLWIVCNMMTQFMNNTATSTILAGIGLEIAKYLNANPTAILMSVLVGSSCAFMTPIGQGTNTMIFDEGGYKFIDYVKSGWLLTVVSFFVSVGAIYIFFPLY